MKALTIQQPWAHLICLPDDDPRAKRVENRRWGAGHRGPLIIHAGKGHDYLSDGDFAAFPGMAFGALVGVAELRGCFQLVGPGGEPGWINGRIPDTALRRWPWLAGHPYVEGPWCWVLAEVRRFDEPIPYRGAQGLFDVPDAVMREALDRARGRKGVA